MDGGDPNLIPQTPGVSQGHEGFQNPPSTPPRLPVGVRRGNVTREFDESGDTTSSSVTLHLEAIASPILAFPSMGQSQHENSDSIRSRDSSSDGSIDISQSLLGREGLNNDNNSSFESLVAPLPNIPGTGGLNSRSGSNFDFNSGNPAIWQGHGHPFTRNRSRRRANSLDEGMPVPRIQLRPRFTRHMNSHVSRTAGAGAGADSGVGRINTNNSSSPPHLMFRQQQHDPSDPSCSCLECLIRAMPSRSNSRSGGNTPPTSNHDEDHNNRHRRSSRPTHFRSHTYNGSDSSNTDIFAMALQTEQFSETSAPIVPVIHGSPAFPFELSSLQQNLPPAAQTFFAPAPRDSTFSHNNSNSNSLSAAGSNSGSGREINSNRDKKLGSYENPSRPIPRHHPNRKLPGHGNSHGHVRHASGSTTTGNGTGTGPHHSPFRTSPSMGTATCTLSLSSVSAFDQTTSPQWQQHSMSLSSQAQSPPDHFFDQDHQASMAMSSPPWQHQLSLSSQSPGHSHSSIVFEKLETQEHEETATSRSRSSIHAQNPNTDQGQGQGHEEGQHRNQKEGIARSHSRTESASSTDFNDNIEGRNQLLTMTKQARSSSNSNSRSRSLPFDEVHLLIDHEQQHDERKATPKPNPDGSTSSSSAQAQTQIKATTKTKDPES